MTITITHPGARLLAPTLDLLADVVAGDWTAAARLCAGRLRAPDACAAELDDLAGRAGVVRARRQPYQYRVWHRVLFVDEPPAVLAAGLDLYTNLMLGRWDTLEQVAPPRRRSAPGWHPVQLLDARLRHQLPGTWPEDTYAPEDLSLAPPTVRLAHQALTEIQGGADRAYDVPAGAPAVHVA